MNTSTATPRPTITVRPPAPGGIETIGAFVGIALAIAAAILGYRILRGGRGL